MRHLDLFSGIGGFAYAVDQVWKNAEHIFCDNDKFCREVIKKHWPSAKIYGDIQEITADTIGNRLQEPTDKQELEGEGGSKFQIEQSRNTESFDLLTGGFPCQPFSQAGKRRGTEDDRYLWPEMFRVIQLAKPQWVIAENVRGLLTQQGGVVFEQVCADLESNGYEVQPFIIPAVAVNAPHRRDRVWILGHLQPSNIADSEKQRNINGLPEISRSKPDSRGRERMGNKCINNNKSDAPDSEGIGSGRRSGKECGVNKRELESEKCQGRKIWGQGQGCSGDGGLDRKQKTGWDENWVEVATRFCRMDDGLPAKLDGFELSKSRHRVERLKSLGNAIVPQVAIEILKAIKLF